MTTVAEEIKVTEPRSGKERSSDAPAPPIFITLRSTVDGGAAIVDVAHIGLSNTLRAAVDLSEETPVELEFEFTEPTLRKVVEYLDHYPMSVETGAALAARTAEIKAARLVLEDATKSVTQQEYDLLVDALDTARAALENADEKTPQEERERLINAVDAARKNLDKKNTRGEIDRLTALVSAYDAVKPYPPYPPKPIPFGELEPHLDKWDYRFIANVKPLDLKDYCIAANHFGIDTMMHLCCTQVAYLIKGKTPAEMTAMFTPPEATRENVKAEE